MGNTEDTLTLNVSRMFPRLRTQATYLEDAEFAPRKQKCFASFLFAHPYNIVSNINSKCFCSNVSSFAPALKVTKFGHHRVRGFGLAVVSLVIQASDPPPPGLIRLKPPILIRNDSLTFEESKAKDRL